MKHYYRITDAIIQIGLLAAWLTTFIVSNHFGLDMYFIVGGWYLVSLVIHLFISSQKYKRHYRNILTICIALVGVFCVGLLLPFVVISVLYVLIFAAPLLAAFYTYDCLAEIHYLHKRPISLLK